MRLRPGLARAVLGAALAGGLLASTTAAAADGGAPPDRLGTASSWTDLFQEKNDFTWSGADQATSVPASNGAVYWLYGDTVLGTENAGGGYDPDLRMVSNTILVQRGTGLTPATASGQAAIPDVPNPIADAVPLNGDETDRYWPVAAVEHAGYLNVFAQRVRNTPDDGLGFQLVGADLARFRISGDALVFEGLAATPSSGVPQTDGPQWAGAVLVSAGYAYVYGHKHTATPHNPQSTYLARVPIEELARPDAWAYWDGLAWTPTQSAAQPLFESQPGSVAIINGLWTVLVKPWGGAGADVLAWTAASPQGPFQSRVLFAAPAGTTPEGRSYVTYAPQLHPEQPLASGATLVSLAWAGRSFWADTVHDADLYKPRFYEVVF
jgi:hypothetical protein